MLLFLNCSKNKEPYISHVSMTIDDLAFNTNDVVAIYNRPKDRLFISAQNDEKLLEIRMANLSEIDKQLTVNGSNYLMYYPGIQSVYYSDVYGQNPPRDTFNVHVNSYDDRIIEVSYDGSASEDSFFGDGTFAVNYEVSEYKDVYNIFVNGERKPLRSQALNNYNSTYGNLKIGFALDSQDYSESLRILFPKDIQAGVYTFTNNQQPDGFNFYFNLDEISSPLDQASGTVEILKNEVCLRELEIKFDLLLNNVPFEGEISGFYL